MFKAKCPLCNGTYQAKPEWIGKQAPCPHCHQRIVIQQSVDITHSGQECLASQVNAKFDTTQNLEDKSDYLTLKFRQHYTFALNNIKQYDYNGFVENFNICLELSNKQFKINPPQIKYLDDDVEHKYPITSLQDILANQYGFSFVEEMASLMSLYSNLPQEYQDETKTSYYADKAKEIRIKLGKVMYYILPKDINKINEGQDISTVAIQMPHHLRGKAIELIKQSDREENVDVKNSLLREGINILKKILKMPKDNLVGKLNISQETIECETASYNECNRDIALCYGRLSNIQNGNEKFTSLDNAYHYIMIFAKDHHNEQVLHDILDITRAIIPLAPQYTDEKKCLEYCISAYLSFAEATPMLKTLPLEERWFAESLEDYILKEVKSQTTKNAELRSQWIQVCKNHIKTFQSPDNGAAMIWMIYGLFRSLTYYVVELKLYEYISEYIVVMQTMLQKLENYLFKSTINMIHGNAKKCLDYTLVKDGIFSFLHIEYMYSQNMLKNGELDKSLEVSQNIIDYCDNNMQIDNKKILDIRHEAFKLNSLAYLEKNDIGKAWKSIDQIADYAEKKYNNEQNLENLTELASAKLNQVILWDKMSNDSEMNLWIIEHRKNYEAKMQLYDIYMLCYNFKGRDEQLSKLMRRIHQSLKVIQEKGLGYLSNPNTLNLVKYYKRMIDETVQLEKEGKHDECMKHCALLINALRDTHFIDIYFEADWYAGILFALGQDSWSKGLKEETEKYYEEASRIRYELETEGISQNKENFALLLYRHALVIINQNLSQDSISRALGLFEKSKSIFEEIKEQLDPNSLNSYSSCCFNLGLTFCIFTTGGNEVGLPLIESAINIMEQLVNSYENNTNFKSDLEYFRKQYFALKNRK